MNSLRTVLFCLFGILLILELPVCSFAQLQTTNYYVYSDPLPDYAKDYASNAIYDSTKAWEAANPNLKFYIAPTIDKQTCVFNGFETMVTIHLEKQYTVT